MEKEFTDMKNEIDVANKVNRSNFIVARNYEQNLFLSQFDKVLEGNFALCKVAGEAGVGKTYLVNQSANELLNVNCVCISGKFKKNDKSNFSAFNEIISSIVMHALTFSDKKLNVTKQLLKNTLEDDAGLIVKICPDVVSLLDYSYYFEEDDYHKLEHRFNNCIINFIEIMSQQLFPLLIHIDDLQWADDASLRLLDKMCTKFPQMNLMLVLSSRNESISNVIDNIEDKIFLKLNRFSIEDTSKYLEMLFGYDCYEDDILVKYVFKSSLGTPFYIKQLIESLLIDGKICYDEKIDKWEINNTLDDIELPMDIAESLKKRVTLLDDQDKHILKILSLLGGYGNVELLCFLNDITNEDNMIGLKKLSNMGILINTNNTYAFSHDIIYEIILDSFDIIERNDMNYDILTKLIISKNELLKSHQTLIGEFILRNKDNIRSKNDTSIYIEELYNAGVLSKFTTMIDQAKKYFEFALEIIDKANKEVQIKLFWELNFECSECLFLLGNIDKAEEMYEKLIQISADKDQLIRLKSKFSLLNTYSGNYDKTLAIGFEVLDHLDYSIDENKIKRDMIFAMLKFKFFVSKGKIDKSMQMKKTSDLRVIRLKRTLLRMSAIANMTNKNLFVLLILRLCSVSLKYGNSDFSGPGYSSLSFMLYHFLGEPEKAKNILEYTRNIENERDDTKATNYFIIGTFMDHWEKDVSFAYDYLMQSVEAGVKGGEYQYAGYSFTAYLKMNYVMGTTINQLFEIQDILKKYDDRLGHHITKNTSFQINYHMKQLSEDDVQPLKEDDISRLDPLQEMTYYYYKIQRLFLIGNIKEAYEIVVGTQNIQALFKAYITQVDLAFFTTLIHIDYHNELRGKEQRRNKKIIEKSMNTFQKWINLYKDNHYARYMILKGKYNSVFLDKNNSGYFYEEALNHAKKNNHPYLAALACLIAGDFYEGNNTVSNIYRKEVVKYLDIWGATHYSNIIRNKYNITHVSDQSDNYISSNNSESLKIEKNGKEEIKELLSSPLSKVEFFDKDQTYMYFLKELIESNEAIKGAIFLEEKDELYLEYEYTNGKFVNLFDRVHVDMSVEFPQKIIRYATRTAREVIISEKNELGIFSNDVYLSTLNELSIICLPLKYMDVFVGILYLEWNTNMAYDSETITRLKNYIPLILAKTIAHIRSHELSNSKKSVKKIPLSKRELDVFKLLVKGHTNKEIGSELHIALSTVKTHIINIYSKLGISNRVAAVEKAIEYGCLD